MSIHRLSKSSHSICLFVGIHHQSAMERVCKVVGGIRVHENCIGEAAGRASETGENQHTLKIVPEGDEFFGDEVHAIVKRAHDTDIRHGRQRSDQVRTSMLVEIVDRAPSALRVTPVDLVNKTLDTVAQITVLG